MKIISTILLFSVLFSLPAAIAHEPEVKKAQARHIIRKTAVVILVAHKKVKEGKVYTGNLARAIAHQKHAIHLYRAGKFYRSIHHSRRARFLALLAIKANKGSEKAEWKHSAEDEKLLQGGPSDNELDAALAKERSAEPTKDEDVINAEPAVDLAEKE